ncbi:ribonuclease III, partial [Candidatus Peregrinibacteria bacterium]|nr:ribonuclease III [Candidatus Peregrinibacteria bacterium]
MAHPTPFVHLEKAIGVRFRNKEFLVQALVHRSAVKESSAHGNNERLEFLGDAVLELATTEYLYHMSKKSEGELTNWRSALVQGNHLSQVAKELKIGDYLFMSRGEEASDGRKKTSTLANAVEALIGAIYLDQGYDVAKAFCEKFIIRNLQTLLAQGKHRDEKSVFQEQAQEKFGITPHYEVIEAEGPDHEKSFTCAV